MADPICRWRNPYVNTIVELVRILPKKVMPAEEFRDIVEKRWPGFLHTPYQLACQVALYYESEDGLYYPRFDHNISEAEAFSYMRNWIAKYYVPNPYTRSLKSLQHPQPFLASIIGYVYEHPDNTELHSILETVFKEKIGNIDIISNVLNTYTDFIKVDNLGNVELTAKAKDFMKQYIDRNDKKAFFENFSESKKVKNNNISRNLIFYGAPGTGKSFEINRITKGEEVIRTTFHPDSDYSTFVGAYKPTSIEVPVRDVTGKVIIENGQKVTENRIVYEFVEQAFLQAYTKAWIAYAEKEEGAEPQDLYLVIEEINRGNCAQIFGDLFQLLDRNCYGFSDYPITADKDMRKQLAKSFKDLTISDAERINGIYGKDIVSQVLSGEILLLPDNLYIWATMNTSDQSLFPIDSAFKRRWDWKYMPICEGKENGAKLDWKIKVKDNLYDWWQFVQKINAEINEQTKSEDKKLGYFFCKAQDSIITAETFVSKVIFYLWNDVFKDQAFASDIFRDGEDDLTFNKFYDVGMDGKAKVVEEKVERLLQNLGLEPFIDDEEDEDEMNGRVRYIINGEIFKRMSYAGKEIMSTFLKGHPDLTFQEIKEFFPDNMLVHSSHRGLIASTDTLLDSYQRYYSPELFTSSDGVTFRIYKQWTRININNIINFAKSQGLDIKVEESDDKEDA